MQELGKEKREAIAKKALTRLGVPEGILVSIIRISFRAA